MKTNELLQNEYKEISKQWLNDEITESEYLTKKATCIRNIIKTEKDD